ncbi:uncharacterized protein LOC114262456 [Camellia sinensis]|uniref:uncharacterized protein LOC114262456 n=1 Tax=Camellia sinensis TaxID=4442 RepID=UPI0010369068|nr:uncharacterized protein LOC114262456 [Camellia sinensis]
MQLEHLKAAPAKFDDLKADVQDPLEEYNLGSKACKRTIYVNANLSNECKSKLVGLLSEYIDCFAWTYEEMPGLDRTLVERRLPIKGNFLPHKQPLRRMTNEVTLLVKEEIERLLKVGFIRIARCPGALGTFEWIVMPFGSKNAGATYQRAMNFIFHDLIGKYLKVYIDDVAIKSDSFDVHLEHLQQTFQRMRTYKL